VPSPESATPTNEGSSRTGGLSAAVASVMTPSEHRPLPGRWPGTAEQRGQAGNAGLSHPARMLEVVSRSRRRLAKGIKPGPDYRVRAPAALASPAERIARLGPSQVLERITRTRVQRDEAGAELAALIDHAVSLGIGWPDIAARLGVSRQAARQQYHRRHRDHAGEHSRPARPGASAAPPCNARSRCPPGAVAAGRAPQGCACLA
jgi:hypothetical protein